MKTSSLFLSAGLLGCLLLVASVPMDEDEDEENYDDIGESRLHIFRKKAPWHGHDMGYVVVPHNDDGEKYGWLMDMDPEKNNTIPFHWLYVHVDDNYQIQGYTVRAGQAFAYSATGMVNKYKCGNTVCNITHYRVEGLPYKIILNHFTKGLGPLTNHSHKLGEVINYNYRGSGLNIMQFDAKKGKDWHQAENITYEPLKLTSLSSKGHLPKEQTAHYMYAYRRLQNTDEWVLTRIWLTLESCKDVLCLFSFRSDFAGDGEFCSDDAGAPIFYQGYFAFIALYQENCSMTTFYGSKQWEFQDRVIELMWEWDGLRPEDVTHSA